MELWVPGWEALRLEGAASRHDQEQAANVIYLKQIRFIREARDENERSRRRRSEQAKGIMASDL
eukprot:5007413-Alexandrium_andersonii.AAC.1